MFKLNKLVVKYLTENSKVVINDTDADTFTIGDDLNTVVSKINKNGVVSLGSCKLNYLWDKREELNATSEDFVEAEGFLLFLKNTLFPSSNQYIAVKMETGGLHTGMYKVKTEPAHEYYPVDDISNIEIPGFKYYPILQLTLQVKGHDAKTWFIDPDGRERRIKPNVVRILERRGDILGKAKSVGKCINVVNKEIKEYLNNCGVKVNNPELEQHTQIVCMNQEFYRAFINGQLPALKDYVSPKYIDLVALNNVAEATQQLEAMVHPQYTDSPEEYTAELLKLFK